MAITKRRLSDSEQKTVLRHIDTSNNQNVSSGKYTFFIGQAVKYRGVDYALYDLDAAEETEDNATAVLISRNGTNIIRGVQLDQLTKGI